MKNLTHSFGNKLVSKSQKTKLVQNVFDRVAVKYDLMNDLMSFGMHRLWKKKFVDIMNIQDNQKIIDIGAGTGDVGLQIANSNPSCKIFLTDLNYSMLEKGKNKKNINSNNIKWIKANAEMLPFPDNYFDKYIISFCLRNITGIKKALDESYRVLKEGGEFYCLEFSSVKLPIVNEIYDKYLTNVIPIIGDYVSNQKKSYTYLVESIKNFPDQEILKNKLKKTGYSKICYYDLFFGIVAIHKGWKI